MKKLLNCILLGAFFLTSCEKEKKPDNEIPKDSDSRLIICNEGNYGSGNASLSVLDLEEQNIYNQVFSSANNSEELGDVLMQASVLNNHLFLVINNSNQIIVADPKTYKKQNTIPIRQPRYIFPIDESRAFVTSMYHHQLYILNYTTQQIIDSIRMPYPNVESVIKYGNDYIVSQWDTNCNHLYILDASFRLKDSINVVKKAPMKTLIDKNNNLWVLSGNMDKGYQPYLTKIDGSSKQIIQAFSFQMNSNNDIIKLQMNAAKDELYFLGINYNLQATQNGLFKMSIDANALPQQPLIQAGNYQYFWDYLIDEAEDKIYLTDPRGFVQRGDVLVYDLSGNYQTKFETYIGPSQMLKINK